VDAADAQAVGFEKIFAEVDSLSPSSDDLNVDEQPRMIVRVYDSFKGSFHSSAPDMSSEQAERSCIA
jgi:indole-3-glycerol phosphate synthase